MKTSVLERYKMKSKTRQDCERAVAAYAPIVRAGVAHLKKPQMLYVGVAGNPLTHGGKPGLDHPELFPEFEVTTLDFDKVWNPDIVGDITAPEDWWDGTPYDLVIITQVIEHIPNVWDVPYGIKQITRRDGFVIVDSPWGPKGPDYHGEPPSFGDYWRISKDGMETLFVSNFHIMNIMDTDANVSALLRKM